MLDTREQQDIAGLARALHDAAHVFNAASNPLRLQLLMSLAEGPRNVADLREALDLDRRTVSQHVHVLSQMGQIQSSRQGRGRLYTLTIAGRTLLQTVNTMLNGSQAEAAPAVSTSLALPSEPGDSLTRLIGRFKVFADPIRLRLLNLFASTAEVCVCHLHEALKLPQSTVSRHLSILRESGLIIGRREGTWVYYRLTRPSSTLQDVLVGALDSPILQSAEFQTDRDRLASLASCKERPRG